MIDAGGPALCGQHHPQTVRSRLLNKASLAWPRKWSREQVNKQCYLPCGFCLPWFPWVMGVFDKRPFPPCTFLLLIVLSQRWKSKQESFHPWSLSWGFSTNSSQSLSPSGKAAHTGSQAVFCIPHILVEELYQLSHGLFLSRWTATKKRSKMSPRKWWLSLLSCPWNKP